MAVAAPATIGVAVADDAEDDEYEDSTVTEYAVGASAGEIEWLDIGGEGLVEVVVVAVAVAVAAVVGSGVLVDVAIFLRKMGSG